MTPPNLSAIIFAHLSNTDLPVKIQKVFKLKTFWIRIELPGSHLDKKFLVLCVTFSLLISYNI
jgi:hypothetical protein